MASELRAVGAMTGDAVLFPACVIPEGDDGVEVGLGAEITGLLEFTMVGEVLPMPNSRVDKRLPVPGLTVLLAGTSGPEADLPISFELYIPISVTLLGLENGLFT